MSELKNTCSYTESKGYKILRCQTCEKMYKTSYTKPPDYCICTLERNMERMEERHKLELANQRLRSGRFGMRSLKRTQRAEFNEKMRELLDYKNYDVLHTDEYKSRRALVLSDDDCGIDSDDC